MKINKFLSLETERNSLRPYHIAVLTSGIFSLCFIYLMVSIPRIDPGDSDVELFCSYDFVIGLTLVVMMGIFSVISGTMASKFIVNEFHGETVILLFSYPISRKKIMGNKILLVFFYTFISMLISGMIIITVFVVTESIIPISEDRVSLELILSSIASLFCDALLSAFCGILSSWIGFVKKSVIATVVSSCLIMIAMCQIVAMTFFDKVTMISLLTEIGIVTFCCYQNILKRAVEMEI